jgi:acetyl esterase/lipase
MMATNRTVRNVTTSLLTPVLPDPAKATGAAVVVAPGGAFMMLSMDSEGYAVAHWLADHGIAAFVLKYRVKPTDPDPKAFMAQVMAVLQAIPSSGKVDLGAPQPAVEDARAAMRLVRSRAREWHIDPNRVGFVGFSAGAMLTLTIGLDPDAAVRPDFIAPIYAPLGAMTVPAYAPPAFFAMASDDQLFGKGGFDLITAWHAAGRPIEFHYFEKGGHGFGMNHLGSTSDLWIDEYFAWMKDRGLLAAATK